MPGLMERAVLRPEGELAQVTFLERAAISNFCLLFSLVRVLFSGEFVCVHGSRQ